jgi:hypothetical protein
MFVLRTKSDYFITALCISGLLLLSGCTNPNPWTDNDSQICQKALESEDRFMTALLEWSSSAQSATVSDSETEIQRQRITTIQLETNNLVQLSGSFDDEGLAEEVSEFGYHFRTWADYIAADDLDSALAQLDVNQNYQPDGLWISYCERIS